MASSGQWEKGETLRISSLAGGGQQTLLRAQKNATTPSQGTDCWHQAVSSDRNDPNVGLVTTAAPGSALWWNWRVLDQSWSPAMVMHRETDFSSILTHPTLPVAQHWPVPGIPARFHFPAQCGHLQPQMLSRAESESARGRGSSCCHKLCFTPSAHILPCDVSWLCSGWDHTATALLSAAQTTPLHPCILLETLCAQRASMSGSISLGLSFLGLDFPFGTRAWGKLVPSWVVAVWDTVQAAPALGLSAAEGLSVYPSG